MRFLPAPTRVRLFLAICIISLVSLLVSAGAQQIEGNIVGHMRVLRGDTPAERVMVTLEVRGAPMDSVYSDSSGTFGFHNLGPNPYYVLVNDEKYEPIRQLVVIDATSMSPTVFVDLVLVPRKKPQPDAGSAPDAKGANPSMVDVHEYTANFPKKAVNEFNKGLNDDASGKREDAIRHYQKAVEIAPDFYLAHNNLGSDYQSKSDFPSAIKEFERVVQLNRSDAGAYFNLSNVYMLTGKLPEAQQYLNEGLRRQPDSALGQFLLGSLNLRLQKLAPAEAALLRAIELSPTMAQARLQLVNVFLKQGRRDAAVHQLREFLDKLPDSPYSAQAKQVLQKLDAQPTPN